MDALHAPLLRCAFQKVPCTSRPRLSNICIGTLCAVLSQEHVHALLLSPGVAILCSGISGGSRLNQVRKNLQHTSKNLPQISIQFAHKVVTLVKFFQRMMSSRNPWSDINSQLPIARHARVFVQARLSKDCRQHLLV